MEKAHIIARASTVQDFADNLLNASCDGSRRDCVEFLAAKIGKEDAMHIAKAFGLRSGFYFANFY